MLWQDVIQGDAKWSAQAGDCLALMPLMPAKSVDLVCFSPPYEDVRDYAEIKKTARRGQEWVNWIVQVFWQCERICRGPVVCVCEGKTRNFRYSATPILLMSDLHRAGFHLRKPPVFYRHGISGSGGPDWFRNDYEFIVCTTPPGKLIYSDNTACGKPPKYGPGGAMSYRTKSGKRKNAVGGAQGAKYKKGDKVAPGDRQYKPPAIANPGNVIKCRVGGGLMGDKFAHENEAPYPEQLPERFVRSFCPPAYCHSCGFVVGSSYHEEAKVQTLPKGVQDARLPPQKIILHEGVLPGDGGKKSDKEGGVRILPVADTAYEAQSARKVLQQDVLGQMDSKPTSGKVRDNEGLCDAVPSGPSECGTSRVCDGASGGDGKEIEKASPKGRSRTSQKRKQVGQSDREPRIEVGRSAHQRALEGEEEKPVRVPEMRLYGSNAEECPKCRAKAVLPGIVLDPFCGSGTTIKVALVSGRRAIGIDLRPSQVDVCERRMAAITPDMFNQ